MKGVHSRFLSGEFPQIAFLSNCTCQIPKLVCDFATCHAAAGWVLKFDLFDAQVPRLPAIWRQSPDALVESASLPTSLPWLANSVDSVKPQRTGSYVRKKIECARMPGFGRGGRGCESISLGQWSLVISQKHERF